jgi:ParB family transcriptional regulator, chromosome partitioning protein
MRKTSSAPRPAAKAANAGQANGDATIVETNVQYLPLQCLALSATNVRKTPATEAEDTEREASIRAKGILQNLIVRWTGIDGPGAYLVDAGGRRLKILQKLAAEGVIDAKEYKVPCKIERPDDAIETSLAENTIRANMHPADEFVAMAVLIDAGTPVEDVASRFGTSERHVRQRLRLGKLAPELLDAFRAGDLNLDTVIAFTLGADHPAQLAVWNQLRGQSYISAHRVRHQLTQAAIALDSDIGMFVGAEAYKAAGGTITHDLFSADDEGFMDDAALVRRLAIEKLEARAEELRPQWAWTKAALDLEYGELRQYARVEPKPGKLPAELAEELERIDQRLAELEDIGGDEFTDELMAEAAKLEERRMEIGQIEEGLAVHSKKDRRRAGCIVTIGDGGEFSLHQGLVDRSTMRTTDADTSDADHPSDTDTDGDFDPEMSSEDEDESALRPSSGAELALRKELGFTQSLVDDLKAHRLQITRAHLAGSFEVAFDLALYWLIVDLFERFSYRTHSLDLKAIEATPRSSLNDLKGTVADQLLEAHRHALDLDWLKLPPAEGFAALAALPIEHKQRLFAWCIAACLRPQLSIEDRADPVIEAAGRRLEIAFECYWRPTAANYWGRVKKAHSHAVGSGILGERWGRDHADDKKATLAAASKRRSIRRRTRPASPSAKQPATQPPRGCRPAWPIRKLPGPPIPPIASWMKATTLTLTPTLRQRLCRRSSPRTSRPAPFSTAQLQPDTHCPIGDRVPSGARFPFVCARQPINSKPQGYTDDERSRRLPCNP